MTEAPQSDFSQTLTVRVMKGSAWTIAGRVSNRVVTLIRVIVLAYLLSPEDFGLFGIVLLALSALETFSLTGFHESLIQRQNVTRKHLDTAWTVLCLRGIGLGAILFATAPLIGAFFDVPKVVPLLRVVSVAPVLRGFTNIGIIFFQKDLQFHRQFAYDTVTAAIGLVVGVVLAYQLRSVWAMVWAQLAIGLTRCLLSYWIHPYRPRARLDRTGAGQMFGFGKWVLASTILVFLVTRGPDAFLAKVLGAAALGVYQLAFRISSLAATEVTHTISIATFPAYAKLQDEPERFRRAYLSVLSSTMLIAVPIAAGTAAIAPHFVNAILGAKWHATIIPIQLLAIYGLLRAYAATTGPVFYASGNPHKVFVAGGIQLVLLGALLWPLTAAHALVGTCMAVVGSLVFTQIYLAVSVCRLLKIGLWGHLTQLLRYACLAGILFGLVRGLAYGLGAGPWPLDLDSVTALVILVSVGIVVYVVMVALLIRYDRTEQIGPVLDRLRRWLRTPPPAEQTAEASEAWTGEDDTSSDRRVLHSRSVAGPDC